MGLRLGGGVVPFSQPLHHISEFFEVNLAVSVEVDLGNDFFPDIFFLLDVAAEDFSNFARINGAATVFIKKTEGRFQVRIVEQVVLINCGRAPLIKVDSAATVSVCFTENLLCSLLDSFRIVGFTRVKLLVRGNKFVSLNQTVPVFVELKERLPELVLLALGRQVAADEGQSCLFQLAFVLNKINPKSI